MNVVTGNPGNVDKLDNGFRLHGGGGVYLAESTADIGTDPFMYWQTNLADNVWSYDIDVSNVGCKCNAAMYWVNMPGYENGSPYPAEWGLYYCDANFVNGNWCPEYDTFEGNDQTMSVAIHTCDYVPPNEYSSCDRAGCGTNACEGRNLQFLTIEDFANIFSEVSEASMVEAEQSTPVNPTEYLMDKLWTETTWPSLSTISSRKVGPPVSTRVTTRSI